MIFGLNLPNYGPLGTRDALVQIATRAEALGYSRLWTSDHVLLPTSLPEPFGHLLETFTTLSYLAASTTTIGLATGVLVLPQREPLLVAKQAATIHHLSDGRMTLGVAVGWIQDEYDLLGADFTHRGHIADEYIAAIRELFTAAQPTFAGDHVRFSDVLFSPRPQSPLRIVVGGDSPAALRRAAHLADGWHGIEQTPDQVRAARIALQSSNPEPKFTVSLRIPLDPGAALPPRSGALTGTTRDVIQQAKAYIEAGVDELVIQPLRTDLESFLDSITNFARNVTTALN